MSLVHRATQILPALTANAPLQALPPEARIPQGEPPLGTTVLEHRPKAGLDQRAHDRAPPPSSLLQLPQQAVRNLDGRLHRVTLSLATAGRSMTKCAALRVAEELADQRV